jgi:hypothetical protein
MIRKEWLHDGWMMVLVLLFVNLIFVGLLSPLIRDTLWHVL